MAFIDASTTQIAYVKEDVEGVTPTTPEFQLLRFTGGIPQYEKESTTSDEIRPDRNVSDIIETGRRASGGFNFELSYGTFDDLLEAVLGGDWAGDVLKNGVKRHSFSFETKFLSGTANRYIRQRGCLINSMALDITSRQILTGNFDILGFGGSASDAEIAGATYLDATTTSVMNAGTSFATLDITGVSPAPTIMGLTVNINNNLREQAAVGSVDLAGIGTGRFEVSGTMNAYFEDLSLYNAMLDHDDIALEFVIGNESGSMYKFRLPKIKLATAVVENAGNNQDVMLNIDYNAILSTEGSPSDNASLIITRGVTV